MDFGKYDKRKLLLLLVFSLVLIQVVSAANVFEQAFEPFKGLSPDFYDNNWWWLDLLAYAFFFISVGQFALKGKMGDEKGRLGIVVGSILAGSMIVYELRNPSVRLANLMPLALFLLSFVLGALVYNFAKGMGASKVPAFSFGFLTTYTFVSIHGSEVLTSLEGMAENNSGAALLLSAFKIGLPIAGIGLIYSIVKGIGHMFGGGFMGTTGGDREVLNTIGRGADAVARNTPGVRRLRANLGKEEGEATQVANVEYYETRLDEFAKRLGKGEINDIHQFENDIRNCIQLADEAIAAERELEQLALEIRAGQYGDAAKIKVQDLRNKYADFTNKLYKRVQAAETFARRERQEFIMELNELIRASQADTKVKAFISSLTGILGADKKSLNQFIRDNKFQGQVKADIQNLHNEMNAFSKLEETKRQVLSPQIPFLRQLIQETDGELRQLEAIIVGMRASAKQGRLGMTALERIKGILEQLLQMSQRKEHGIQHSEDILNKVSATDQKLRQIMAIYRRLLSTEFQQLGVDVKRKASTQLNRMNKLGI